MTKPAQRPAPLIATTAAERALAHRRPRWLVVKMNTVAQCGAQGLLVCTAGTETSPRQWFAFCTRCEASTHTVPTAAEAVAAWTRQDTPSHFDPATPNILP